MNYGPWYDGATVGLDSEPNDCHFNSIAYIPEIGQLIVNSRNSSHYMEVDRFSFLPIWNVQNPEVPLLLNERINLAVVNPDKHVYINGAHTAFPTYNEKYLEFWSDGKIVLTIFDNTACKDEDGVFLVKSIYDQMQDDDAGYPWDAALSVVSIDLNSRTVEQLDYYTIPGQRSRITSNVFDSRDRRYFYYHVGVPSNFFVMDRDGGVALEALNLFPAEVIVEFDYTYRARIFSFYEIRELVDRQANEVITRYDETDPRIVYHGNWVLTSSHNYYGGSQHYTLRNNDTLEFRFEGTSFNIIAAVSSNYRGSLMEVFVDGELIGTYGYYLTSGTRYQQTVYESPDFYSGVHTVQLRNASMNSSVYLDALDIRGELL